MSPGNYSVGRCHRLYDERDRDKAAQRKCTYKMIQWPYTKISNIYKKWKLSYLMKASTRTTLNPSAHPARLNTAGRVRAPVPTMRLKMYTSPTYGTRMHRWMNDRVLCLRIEVTTRHTSTRWQFEMFFLLLTQVGYWSSTSCSCISVRVDVEGVRNEPGSGCCVSPYDRRAYGRRWSQMMMTQRLVLFQWCDIIGHPARARGKKLACEGEHTLALRCSLPWSKITRLSADALSTCRCVADTADRSLNIPRRRSDGGASLLTRSMTRSLERYTRFFSIFLFEWLIIINEHGRTSTEGFLWFLADANDVLPPNLNGTADWSERQLAWYLFHYSSILPLEIINYSTIHFDKTCLFFLLARICFILCKR